jgi:two-component system, NtrC family, response regulator AtoC
MARKILVVDDDPKIRESLCEALTEDGGVVRTAESASAALSAVAEDPPDLVISDVRMPGTDGLELLRLLRERSHDVDVILMTAFDDMSTVVAAMREGAFEFLVKPLDLHELRRLLDKVFADRRIRRSDRRTAQPEGSSGSDELIGRHPRMIEIYKQVGKLARTRSNVLIRGETGTGKELVARAIHFSSEEADEPFVPVNCTALPEALLESELFGHVKGAFTGAVERRQGRFALAGRGTIFLDEIGDTSPEFQAKLLRVLQEREFYPVGAERPERTEARVVAATHRDLEKLMDADRFRSDLYYRLQVVEITVPPLRDRLTDLPLLADHLVQRTAARLRRPPPALSPEALGILAAHHWPGNVRELENCLQRAVVLSTGGVIRPEHIFIGHGAEGAAEASGTLEEVERAHLARVYRSTEGHKSRTADLLGISRPRLDRLLRKHGLEG